MSETMNALTFIGDPRPGFHVEVDHLYLGYPGKSRSEPVVACCDLSFTISHGEFVVLVGPSGCGKTTFLEALAGLGHVGAGELRIDGKLVTGPGRDRSLVFQAPSLFPWRDVYGNVIFGVQAQGRLDEAAKERARAIIEMVGLSHVARWRPQELSGGMKQRANLARALVTEPRLRRRAHVRSQRGVEERVGLVVAGQQCSGVTQAGVQRRCRGAPRRRFHLRHDGADGTGVAAADGGFREIPDRKAPDRLVIGRIRRVMDAPKVPEGRCRVAAA